MTPKVAKVPLVPMPGPCVLQVSASRSQHRGASAVLRIFRAAMRCNALRPDGKLSSRPRWPRVERFRQLGKRLGVAQARVSEEVPCAVSSFEGPSQRGVGWRWRRLRDSGGIQHHSGLLRCSVYAQRPGERGSDTEGGQDEICAGVESSRSETLRNAGRLLALG